MVSEFIFGTLVFIAAVTLIGHGLWVVFARIGKALGLGGRSQTEAPRDCPVCRSWESVKRGRCEVCGAYPFLFVGPSRPLPPNARTIPSPAASPASPPPPAKTSHEELIGLLRQLREKGELDQEPYEKTLAAVYRNVEKQRREQETPTPIFAEVVAPPPIPVPLQLPTASVESPPAAIPSAPSVPLWEVHPLDRPAVPPPPKPPRRSFADVIQTFFQEKNIRLGEVIAAFFIVISSVGLVISLRSTLARIPYFPAIAFLTFTLGFHGAGMYSLRKWKLRTVSRVVLLISLLLVPLSFAAALVLQPPTEVNVFTWLILAAGLVGASWVVASSSKELMPDVVVGSVVGLVGASLAQAPIDASASKITETSMAWLLGLAPTVPFLFAAGSAIWGALRRNRMTWTRTWQTLRLLGTSWFAVAIAFTLLVTRLQFNTTRMGLFTPAMGLATGAAILAIAILTDRARAQSQKLLRFWMAIIVAALGILECFLLVIAWPAPVPLISLLVINAVAFGLVGYFGKASPAYAAALLFAAGALLIGVHFVQGRLFVPAEGDAGLQLVSAIFSGRSSVVLFVIAGVSAIVAEWLRVQRRWTAGWSFLTASGAIWVAGLLMAVIAGFGRSRVAFADPNVATPVLLAHGIGAFFGAIRLGPTRISRAVLVASVLAWFGGLFHATWHFEPIRSWLEDRGLVASQRIALAAVLNGLVVAVTSLVMSRKIAWASPERYASGRETARWAYWINTLTFLAVLSSSLSLLGFVSIDREALSFFAVLLGLAALSWGIASFINREASGVTVTQWGFAGTVGLLVARSYRTELISSSHIASQFTAISLGAMVWLILRRSTERSTVFKPLLSPSWRPYEHFAMPLFAMLFVAFSSSICACLALIELGYIHKAFEGLQEWNLRLDRFPLANSPAVWVALFALFVGALVNLWDRSRPLQVAVVATLLLGLVLVSSDAFRDEFAVASAIRWGVGIGLILLAIPVVFRNTLCWLWNFTRPREATWTHFELQAFRITSLSIAIGVILGITVAAVRQSVVNVPFGGPDSRSWFGAMGFLGNYVAPLGALVVVCLAYSVREKNEVNAFAGFLIAQLGAVLGVSVWSSTNPSIPFSTVSAVWLQTNALVAIGYGVLWYLGAPFMSKTGRSYRDLKLDLANPELRNTPTILATLLSLAALFWALFAIVTPFARWPGEEQLGAWPGFVVMVLTLGLLVLERRQWLNALGRVIAAGVVSGILLWCVRLDGLALLDPSVPYITLLWSWIGVALAIVVVTWVTVPMRTPLTRISTAALHEEAFVAPTTPGGTMQRILRRIGEAAWDLKWYAIGLFVACLGLTSYCPNYDPLSSAIASLAIAFGIVAIAVHRRREGFSFLSIAAIYSTIAWTFDFLALPNGPRVFDAAALTCVMTFGIWLSIRLVFLARDNRTLAPEYWGPSVVWTSSIASLILATLWTLYRDVGGAFREPFDTGDWVRFGVVFALFVLFAISLWDRASKLALFGMFLVGLLVSHLAVDSFQLSFANLVMGLLVTSASYLAVVGFLWRNGTTLASQGSAMGISDPVGRLARTGKWLPGMEFAIAVVIGLSAMALAPSSVLARPVRVGVALSPLIAGAALAFFCQHPRRLRMQQLALAFVALGVVLLGWSDLRPDAQGASYDYAFVFRTVVALAATSFVYLVVVPKFVLGLQLKSTIRQPSDLPENEMGSWSIAFRRAGLITSGAAAMAHLVLLEFDRRMYSWRLYEPVEFGQEIVVSIVLVALIATFIALALKPGFDPLKLSELWRRVYVYFAQAMALMLLTYFFLCRPGFFDQTLRPYWPYIVLAIAFASATTSEIAKARRSSVLSEPFLHFGAFLGLLPIIGVWYLSSQSDYAIVYFFAGLVFATLSYWRGSFLAGLLAAGCGNAALWIFFSRASELSFFAHPQLWLIPPALSSLVVAQVQKHNLNKDFLSAVRYVAILVIYLSSASEVFIIGVAGNLWSPMILAVVSLVGVAFGIALKIRSFLFLGNAFALLSLVSMVWRAAQAIDHVWPWWVFGIATGLAILLLFGFYEKRRNDVNALIDRLRQWER